MPTTYTGRPGPINPPGLREQEKRALTRLEKKKTITPFEAGQLRAYVRFGHREDSERADRLLKRYERQREAEHRKEEETE